MARDAVERLVEEWGAVAPHLDLSCVEVVNRVLRLAPVFERALSDALGAHDLTLPEFSLLSVLRRRGAADRVPQRDLPGLLGLTPATVSVRVDALQDKGLVDRCPGDDARSRDVELTPEGRDRLEAAVRDHLATEQALVACLDAEQHAALVDGLRALGRVHDAAG